MRSFGILLLSVFTFISSPAVAERKPLNWIELPARTVLLACQDAHSDEPRVRAVGRTICESLVSAYVDGFMRGSIFGNGMALVHDQKTLHTIEGIDDLSQRMDALDMRHRCRKGLHDLDEIVLQWTARVYTAQDIDKALYTPYTTSLHDVISEHFCPYDDPA